MPLWGGQPIAVQEVRRLAVCNSDGPQAKVTLFAHRDAVLAWQQARGVDLAGEDPLPSAGAYVLAEMGVRTSAGFGLAISRQASVSGGGEVTLNATLFSPDSAQAAAPSATSPCVLVALPDGVYHGAELRDPAGSLLARVEAPVQ
ncbi:MAG: hypothetical protein P4L83_21370 [Nevskia sp.]|nr:hypothetical protein [Nevskia sp.]